MASLLHTALSNALLVTAVAPIVWAITRLTGKPALTHALWLVVLLKLIIPPLWLIPFHWPQARQVEVERMHESDVPAVLSSGTGTERITESTDVPNPLKNLPTIRAVPELQSASTPVARGFDTAHASETAFESLWIAGSLFCLATAAIRTRRFARNLHYATLAPDPIQVRIEQLALQLNLNRGPRVWFIPGTLCPMLWAAGGHARLLIPWALWERLNSTQRDAILIHELAHWKRRDHWVRWIELVATTLYWWHPACWLARRELREAEEQCCDAWVLSTTGDFRHYANALLEAVEFVSSQAERPFRSSDVPALASGLGQFGHLKRRIIMLRNGNISRALSRCGIAATFAMASLLLPLSPSFAQNTPKAEVSNSSGDLGTASIADDVPLAQPGTDNSKDADRQLRDARRQIADLARKLQEAQARIVVLQHGGNPVQSAPNTTAAQSMAAFMGQLARDKKTSGSEASSITDPNSGAFGTTNNTPNAPFGTTTAETPMGLTPAATPPAMPTPAYPRTPGDQSKDFAGPSRVWSNRAPGTGTFREGYRVAASGDRLDRIEAELGSLLNEVEAMRKQKEGNPFTPSDYSRPSAQPGELQTK